MSIGVVPFVVCLVLRSLRFTACRVFSGCISLGVKQVAERLGITSGGLLNLKLPEPDAMIGRTRGWLPDDRRMEREAPRSGRRRRQTPKKQVTGIRGWLQTNDLRFWRPPLYVWCAPSGICGVRHACRGNRNRLCINTNNRSRGSLEVVRIFAFRALPGHAGRTWAVQPAWNPVGTGYPQGKLRCVYAGCFHASA